MHTLTHAHTQTCTCMHTCTPVAYQGNQGNETEEKVFKKRKVFKEDLKELTAVEWQTETGSWFQITGACGALGEEEEKSCCGKWPFCYSVW